MTPYFAPNRCKDCVALRHYYGMPDLDAKIVMVRGDKRTSLQHAKRCPWYNADLDKRIATVGVEDIEPVDWREALGGPSATPPDPEH